MNTSANPNASDRLVLLLQVPRTNEKKELAAEQMFAALHGLLTFPPKNFFDSVKRETISLEIAVIDRSIAFYVSIPTFLKDFVEEQIYAQYPTVEIRVVDDYSDKSHSNNHTWASAELKLTASDVLPIKTFQSFEVDPLAAITASLAKFEKNEEAWIQLIIKPASKNWHRKNERYVNSLRTGGGTRNTANGLFGALWNPPEYSSQNSATKLTEYDQTKAKSAEEKSHKLAFESTLRIVFKGNNSQSEAILRLQSIVAAFKQFNTTYLNGFVQGKTITDSSLATAYQKRLFSKKPFVLNIEEVATLYHLPHTNVETPYILWAKSQTAEPPTNLPVVSEAVTNEISPIAAATFRGQNTPFGLRRSDRGRHLYIIGQTGVGKSGLLELLTISDIYSPFGFAVIDPHGDYATSILSRIPENRIGDVIYFNPSDVDYPVAFNPMEVHDAKLKTQTASELIGVLKRMFDSWGPRLEYILRYSILALLEYPDATMLDITRILTDKKFRIDVLKYVSDPVVSNFWKVEFASWNDKFAAEAVAPVLNKIGAFTANPLVRNIIGQPKSSFNIRKIIDENKILIVNLSRGLVGEDNAAILGALMVTKIQLAAMSRADIPVEMRTPFYLYVDEFQNFATESFATILSEARKYGLNLTVANQYIAQMPQDVKDAVFGNVGSMIAFRMGADDARGMQKYFEPKFLEYDLIHMHNRHFVISMTIDGEKVQAFSATTLTLPENSSDFSPQIVDHSRSLYAVTSESVESDVLSRYDFSASTNVASLPKDNKPATNKKQPRTESTTPKIIPKSEEPEPEPKPLNPEALDLDSKHPHLTDTESAKSLGKTVAKVLDILPESPKKRRRKRTRKKKTSPETSESNSEKLTTNKQSATSVVREPQQTAIKNPNKKENINKPKSSTRSESTSLSEYDGEIIFKR